MDPVTLIVLLAGQFIFSAAVLFLLGRGLPPRCGIGLWSLGGVLFGMACLARLMAGLHDASPLTVPVDTAMVVATLLFIAGARQYLGLSALRPQTCVWVAGVFATSHLMLLTLAGPLGRLVVLYLTLGGLYTALAWHLWQLERVTRAMCQVFVRLLTLGVASLAQLTLLRLGTALFAGFEQATLQLLVGFYDLYAALCIMLLGLTLLWLVLARRSSAQQQPRVLRLALPQVASARRRL